MRNALFAAAALTVLPFSLARAEETAPARDKPWTLTTNRSWSFSTDDAYEGSDTRSFSVSLERAFGDVSVGVGGGPTKRKDDTVILGTTFPDVSGYSIGGWVTPSFGATSVTVSVDYASESFDSTDFVLPGGATTTVSGASDFINAGIAVSRVFGEGTRLAPNASLAWTRAKDEYQAEGAHYLPFTSERVNSGVIGSFGATLAHDVASKLTIYANAAGVASSNADAVFSLTSVRTGSYSAPQRYSNGEGDFWGEFAAGAVLYLGRASITLEADGTAGLNGDYVLASVSTSFSF